ncbi:MAG: hypothetical protein SVM80_03550 [Halobacteriota archaeon]|nr:hypothetical protein [Halobacteriota archaeon]
MADEEEKKSKEFDMAENFRKGVFLILMILLLISTIHFYISITDAVSTLFDYRYRSLVKAGFAACVIAITALLLRNVIVGKN